jgi:hypothetical protein
MGITFVPNRAFRACLALLGLALATSMARAQELPPGEMRDTVWAACSHCHQVTRFTALRKTRAGWTVTVNDMINKGAVIGDNEFDRIVDYLARNFGPVK